jgi:hypothetical protein
MKPIRIAWCLAAAVLVLGCDNVTDPAAQADELTEATFKAEHTYLVREFTWDTAELIACANDGAGEYLQWDGIVVAATRKLLTASPLQTRSTKIDEFKGLNFDEFQATGLTSGDVWIINPKGSTWTARWNGDRDSEFWNWHQTYSFKFTNQYGERLHVQGTRVEKYDRNGELVLLKYNRGSCPEVW